MKNIFLKIVGGVSGYFRTPVSEREQKIARIFFFFAIPIIALSYLGNILINIYDGDYLIVVIIFYSFCSLRLVYTQKNLYIKERYLIILGANILYWLFEVEFLVGNQFNSNLQDIVLYLVLFTIMSNCYLLILISRMKYLENLADKELKDNNKLLLAILAIGCFFIIIPDRYSIFNSNKREFYKIIDHFLHSKDKQLNFSDINNLKIEKICVMGPYNEGEYANRKFVLRNNFYLYEERKIPDLTFDAPRVIILGIGNNIDVIPTWFPSSSNFEEGCINIKDALMEKTLDANGRIAKISINKK